MRLVAALLWLFALLASAVPWAGAAVTGQVFDAASGSPLGGVAVVAEASGRRHPLPQPTGPAGRFSFDPEAVFTAEERDTVALSLLFTHSGYREVVRLVRADQRGVFARDGLLTVRLERILGQQALTPETAGQLAAARSADGRTLFLVPYDMGPTPGDEDGARFHRLFARHLKRGIVTHLQALDLESLPGDVGVATVPLPLDVADTERVRLVGNALNALAMVSGFGSLASGAAGDAIEISSEYLIIPSLPTYTPRTLYVDERLPADCLRSGQLFQGLDQLWGRNTALALALLEARQALQGAGGMDRAALGRARSLLIAERAQAGSESDALVRQLTALVEVLDGELTP